MNSFLWGVWVCVWIHFFACGCLVIITPPVDQTFFPHCITFKFLSEISWLYLCGSISEAHCCVPLICLYVLSAVPHWNWLNVNLQPPYISLWVLGFLPQTPWPFLGPSPPLPPIEVQVLFPLTSLSTSSATDCFEIYCRRQQEVVNYTKCLE